MTVTSGFGAESLHLHQSSDVVSARFGNPKERREVGSFREYWLYPDAHFDCIVSRRTHRLLGLFLYAGNPFGEEAMFGKTEACIREMYASLPQEGGGFTLSSGDYVGRWLSYDEGIGFDFDARGELRTISIFAPKQKAKRKPVGVNLKRHSASIAALRNR